MQSQLSVINKLLTKTTVGPVPVVLKLRARQVFNCFAKTNGTKDLIAPYLRISDFSSLLKEQGISVPEGNNYFYQTIGFDDKGRIEFEGFISSLDKMRGRSHPLAPIDDSCDVRYAQITYMNDSQRLYLISL